MFIFSLSLLFDKYNSIIATLQKQKHQMIKKEQKCVYQIKRRVSQSALKEKIRSITTRGKAEEAKKENKRTNAEPNYQIISIMRKNSYSSHGCIERKQIDFEYGKCIKEIEQFKMMPTPFDLIKSKLYIPQTEKFTNNQPKSSTKEKILKQILKKNLQKIVEKRKEIIGVQNKQQSIQQKDYQQISPGNDTQQKEQLPKAFSDKVVSHRKQKYLPCKIALKNKGKFPLCQKAYEQMKLIAIFGQDSTVLSKIQKKEQLFDDEMRQSMQNYRRLIF